MRGTIKAYSLCVNAGVIECETGKTYDFRESDWNGNTAPSKEQKVQFDATNRTATSVRALK